MNLILAACGCSSIQRRRSCIMVVVVLLVVFIAEVEVKAVDAIVLALM